MEGCGKGEAVTDEDTKVEVVSVFTIEEGSVCDTTSGVSFNTVVTSEDATL